MEVLHSQSDEEELGVDILDTADAGGRVLRGGLLRLLSYVATVGLSVISMAVLTRHLLVGAFGQYTTVLSLATVVAAVTDAGMSTIGTREYATSGGARREELMSDLLGLRVALTLVGVLLACGFALAAGYDSELLLGTLLASLGTVALVIQHTYTIPVSAELRLGTLSGLELARQVLSVAAIVGLSLLGAGVMPLLAVVLAVNLILIPPTAAIARRAIALRARLRTDRWKALLRVTVSYSLATAVGSLYVYAAQIITSLVAGKHQSGLFAASFRIFIVAAAVPGLLVNGAFPLLARAARDDRLRLAYALQRILEVSLILGIAATLAMLGGAQFVIRIVASPRFAAAAPVLQIQSLAMIASFVLAGWGYALLSLERHRAILAANALALVLSCVVTFLLAGSDGAQGAALATLIGESALAGGQLVALVIGHPELRPQLKMPAKVVLCAVPAAALALLPDWPSLVRAIVALAAYSVLLMAARAYPTELLELVRRRRAVTR